MLHFRLILKLKRALLSTTNFWILTSLRSQKGWSWGVCVKNCIPSKKSKVEDYLGKIFLLWETNGGSKTDKAANPATRTPARLAGPVLETSLLIFMLFANQNLSCLASKNFPSLNALSFRLLYDEQCYKSIAICGYLAKVLSTKMSMSSPSLLLTGCQLFAFSWGSV